MPVPNTSPLHLTNPQPFQAIVNAANTLRDGTGTLVPLVTALAAGNGGAVLSLRATHAGAVTVASTAMVVRLWHVRGSVARLIRELALPSATPTTAGVLGSTVALAAADLPELLAGDSISATCSVAEAVHFYGTYREY
jgi:hypothetical protein